MYCMECGKQIREGARFCPVCGADQSGALPGSEEARPVSAAAPVRYRTEAPTRESVPVRRAKTPARKKKSPAAAIIAVVLVLALLAGGGYLLYNKVIFPRNTVKNAEVLVQHLAASPLRDTPDDFSLRIDLHKKDYYAIQDYPEAELKVKDYLKQVYGQGNYSVWVHSLHLLQDSGLYYSPEDVSDIVDRKDVEDLFVQGGPININSGWYADVDHEYAVYSEYPGFMDESLFDVYIWGDVMAVRSHEYGWNLFYRGYELPDITPANWSSTSADQIQYIFLSGRQAGTLLILAFDANLDDGYLVLDTATGDCFQVYYDF